MIAAKACKNGCPTGGDRRSCFKACKKSLAAALLLCWQGSGQCIAGCLPPPPTTTLP